ncbi:MAG: DUF1800 domain-containing protein [Acidobacteriia bacterium]|nr:DUF1800 domain-containing protein [Terriglobia bacterium]
MPFMRKALPLLSMVMVVSAVLLVAADKKAKDQPASPQMDDEKKIVHALNRLTFGIRPGDVERVRAMGLDKWLDEQLHPDKISDASLDSRLAPLRTLKMSTREMVENFPPPQVVKAVENGRMGLPRDPAKRAIYQAQVMRREERQERKQSAAGGAGESPAASAPGKTPVSGANKDVAAEMEMQEGMKPAGDDSSLTPEQRKAHQKQKEDAMYADLGMAPAPAKSDSGMTKSNADPKPSVAQKQKENAMYADVVNSASNDRLMQMAPDDRYHAILQMTPEARMDMADSYRGGKVFKLVEGMSPQQQETIEAIVNPQLVVGGELSQGKLLRAIYSERQLDEVMTDFWYNHFNVFIGKGPDRYMITAYERDVIRPRALGKFKDLLVATAQSPAMLFYLDNWQSVGPNSELAVYGPGGMRRARRRGPFAPFPRPQQNKNRPSGLNENYAREIMELHTLGVDGGYTQQDVTELAKVLTGWSIEKPQQGGGFKFNERAHEPGNKLVLGRRISEGGEKEGMEMLDVLAHHPATAKFISRKLAMRFVSDNPPQSLVDRMADAFLKKDGDIKEVLRTMFKSPEFWAADAYRAKVKTPLEFVASAARASGADVQNALPMVQFLNRMGMQLYGMQPPTGYSMKGDAWVNSSALLNRMNFALALGTGKLPGTALDPQTLLRGPTPTDADAALALLEKGILSGDVSPQTHAVIQKQLNDPQVTQRKLDDPNRAPNTGAIAGLIMGSPEFQRR